MLLYVADVQTDRLTDRVQHVVGGHITNKQSWVFAVAKRTVEKNGKNHAKNRQKLAISLVH